MTGHFDPEVATTQRLIAGLIDAVVLGLDEAGLPLTDEQRAWLAAAPSSMTNVKRAAA